MTKFENNIKKSKKLKKMEEIVILRKKITKKNCKKNSDKRCSPHKGEMDQNCELSEKNRCVLKKKKSKSEKEDLKSCKKISNTRCSPHKGEMDQDCELSEKNRCVIKKEDKLVKKSDFKKKTNSNINNNSNSSNSDSDSDSNINTNTNSKKEFTKSCKKVSESKCIPHDGEMDKNCMLTEKNRCIVYDESKNKLKKMELGQLTNDEMHTADHDMKKEIIDALDIMKKNAMINGDQWRERAYTKAIGSIKKIEKPILKIDDIKGAAGVGQGIFTKIDEIISTGKLEKAEKLKSDPKLKLVSLLTKITGIGPKNAIKLIDENNVQSLEDLKKRQDTLLNDKQKIGLKYYKDIEQRIPRKEMDKHNKLFQKIAKQVSPNLIATVVGSYRRKAESSGDIDILLHDPINDDKNLLKKFISKLRESNYLIDDLAYGAKKYNGICKLDKLNRRIDILFTPKSEYPFALLYFTGSGNFNLEMRKILASKGYRLNEHHLKKKNKIDGKFDILDYKFDSEEDIFKYFEIPYIEPENRNETVLKELDFN